MQGFHTIIRYSTVLITLFILLLSCDKQTQQGGSPILRKLNCTPLITTSGFMAPEAYSLEAIVRYWADKHTIVEIHLAAAQAYAKYQRDCTLTAAKRLFKAGVSIE